MRIRSAVRPPFLIAVLALGAATAALSGCGSGAASSAASSVAKEATNAISGAAKTQTTPAKAQTVTKTTTQSAAGPSVTNSTTNSATANIHATQTTPAAESSGGGLPWWAWVLIGVGVVGVVAAIFAAGRHRGKATSATTPPGTADASPPPATGKAD